MTFKKTLINFAMIQTVALATSINLGVSLSAFGDPVAASAFFYMLTFLITFLPALAVSFTFALLSK